MKIAPFLTLASGNALDMKRLLPGNLLREAREKFQIFDPIPEGSFGAKPVGDFKLPRGDSSIEKADELCKVRFSRKRFFTSSFSSEKFWNRSLLRISG